MAEIIEFTDNIEANSFSFPIASLNLMNEHLQIQLNAEKVNFQFDYSRN